MKKKISVLCCAFVLLFSLAGCGGKQDVAYSEQELTQYAEGILTSFAQMDERTFAAFREGSELEVNMALMQAQIPVERDEFVSMIQAWEAALGECGEYLGHGEYRFKAGAGGVSVETDAEFADRDATILFAFDEKLNMESMDVSAKYSTAEILQKAGMNTILGMGTVFLVLMFLAFVISLFKYIPVIQSGFVRKRAALDKPPVRESELATAEPETEESELADDLELVAVITAAIAAAEETSPDGFVVRSVRRRKSNKWN